MTPVVHVVREAEAGAGLQDGARDGCDDCAAFATLLLPGVDGDAADRGGEGEEPDDGGAENEHGEVRWGVSCGVLGHIALQVMVIYRVRAAGARIQGYLRFQTVRGRDTAGRRSRQRCMRCDIDLAWWSENRCGCGLERN